MSNAVFGLYSENMLLFKVLTLVFYQAFLTAATCPETFIVKNVKWNNSPSHDYSWFPHVNEINGKEWDSDVEQTLVL